MPTTLRHSSARREGGDQLTLTDNRLVAAELERRWEAALNEVRVAEEALAQQASPQAIAHIGMGKALHGKVVSLAGRLPPLPPQLRPLSRHRVHPCPLHQCHSTAHGAFSNSETGSRGTCRAASWTAESRP